MTSAKTGNSGVQIVIGILLILALMVALYFLMPRNTPTPNTTPTPATTSEAKININAVCEGALAYMTFPDGASADAFVADCKEGKHPEVIEKYKADLNLGAGAEI